MLLALCTVYNANLLSSNSNTLEQDRIDNNKAITTVRRKIKPS